MGRAGLIGLLAAGACTAATVRPSMRPLPGAVVDTVQGQPDSIVDRLAAAIEAQGLPVRRRSAAEGYVETQWYDLAARRARGPDHLASDRVVKLRVWVDALPPGETVVVLEAVHQFVTDPSQPGRELEVLVPAGHQADSIIRRVLGALDRRQR
ncbi:MAG TPA: hypothetical protein VF970_03160 [Gemmatimonadales bacterium]